MSKNSRSMLALFCLLLLPCISANAVTLGQIDDFEDGTVQNWTEGLGSPNAPTNVAGGPPGSTRTLRDISSGALSSGGKMTLFNESAKWSGNYIAAGITEIRVMVRVDPSSAGALSLRVGFQEATKEGFTDGGYFSLVPIVVPDDGNWYEIVFPIEASDMANEGFHGLTYQQTLSNVGQFRIYHSTAASWQGLAIAAQINLDNITAGPVSTDTNYTGWLWETSVYSNGLSVQEDNCFGPFNVVLSEDQNWTASGTDEVCRGRDTQSNSRNFMNPLPSDFEAQSTQPMVSAGGNLYELYGEDVVGGAGEGEARLATALFEPSDGRLLFLSGHESTDEPGNLESFGFLHLLAKTTPSIVTARTAADLEGTSWRVASAVHARNDGSVNGETASSTVLTVDFEAGGVCTYSPSTVFPDFVNNRDVYVATQFSTAGNLDNRAVQAGVSGAEFSECSYAIDAEGYLAIDVTLTVDTNPLNPIAVALRYTVSDDEQYLVAAPAAAGPESGFRGLAAGFRAANALPANSIDGNYLFYLMLSEFGATGTFHSGGEFGRQEFDFRGRGLFSFDSSVPGTVPNGETGTWFECSANMVQNGFELGYSGDYGVGTASPDAEVSAEDLTFTGCDYRLGADGGLSVHVVVTVPGDPAPLEATLHGYVNSNGEVLALALGTSEPPPSSPATEDFGSVFFVLGMQYTGDPSGNADGDQLSNLHEFQFPIPPEKLVPLLLRRDDNGRWFRYALNGTTIEAADSVDDLTSGLVWSVESTSDFDGDGKDDVLIRRTDIGSWYLYLMDGAVVLDSASMSIATSLDWQIAAVTDFNNDGTADLLLSNSANGRWRMYLMDGLNILQTALVNLASSLVWDTVASGDFDLDGFGDVLIRRSDNGRWRIYRFNGISIEESALVGITESLVWQFQRAADFNGDGRLDVLVRRTDNWQWRLYFMNGTSVLGTELVGLAASSAWQLESVADFDMDGRADALLRNTATGVWRLYLLNGATINSTGVLAAIPGGAEQVLQAVADFNFDGNADMLLRNVNNGQWTLYTLNGTTVESSGNVAMSNNLVWEIMAPPLH